MVVRGNGPATQENLSSVLGYLGGHGPGPLLQGKCMCAFAQDALRIHVQRSTLSFLPLVLFVWIGVPTKVVFCRVAAMSATVWSPSNFAAPVRQRKPSSRAPTTNAAHWQCTSSSRPTSDQTQCRGACRDERAGTRWTEALRASASRPG